MTPRALVVVGALLVAAGCDFHIRPVFDVDAGGSEDDAGVVDLAAGGGADLAHPVPDGAVPRANGYPCSGAGECDSGACVDGYCCDSPCAASDPASFCHACNVPGLEGHCVAARAGTDPHQQCAPEPANPCGRDGLCDGAGACRVAAAGTACGSGSCTNGMLMQSPACDGAGKCAPGAVMSCAPYACASATACATTCTPPANGCLPPAVCDNGSCGKHADGQPCNGAGECQSGFCAQDVCCDSACTGACQACDLPGQVGQCTPRPPGTQCAAAMCVGDRSVSARFCDASGTCLQGMSRDCTPYTCNTAITACFTRPCQNSTQCASGHTCQSNGKCQ
jgi:hypothetical protein